MMFDAPQCICEVPSSLVRGGNFLFKNHSIKFIFALPVQIISVKFILLTFAHVNEECYFSYLNHLSSWSLGSLKDEDEKALLLRLIFSPSQIIRLSKNLEESNHLKFDQIYMVR